MKIKTLRVAVLSIVLLISTLGVYAAGPVGVTDPTLWLDADDTNDDGIQDPLWLDVASWSDKSGNNNNLTSVGATHPSTRHGSNDRRALLFTWNEYYDSVNEGQITDNSSYTEFMVFKRQAPIQHSFLIGSATDNGNLSFTVLYLNSAENIIATHNNDNFMSVVQPFGVDNFHITTSRYGSPDSLNNVINFNGDEILSNSVTKNFINNKIRIGGTNSGGNNNSGSVTMGEILIYDRALSDDEINNVECYLSHRWDIDVSQVCPKINLDKTNYDQYKVFQRDENNEAEFTLNGTYTGTCTSVEASFAGGVFTVIDDAPSGGTFSGVLTGNTGQGDIILRCSKKDYSIDRAEDIGIGDVYVVAGQSNAEGEGVNLQGYSTVAPTSTVIPTVYTEADVWKKDNDRTDPDGGVGSVWPIVGGYIVENTNIPVAFITTARGGTALVDNTWTKGNSVGRCGASYNVNCYANMINQINEANTGGVKAVLWFQGETDAINLNVSHAEYNTALDLLASNIKADILGAPKLVSGVIGQLVNKPTEATRVRLAIQDAWDDNSDILYGPQSYDIDIVDGIGDDIHFSQDDEIQTLAFRWWKAIEDHYYSGSEGRGPVISGAQLISSTQVNVDFIANSGLQGGTAPEVWFIDDNGVSRTVIAAVLLDSNTVQLTLDTAITSDDVKLSYAKGLSAEDRDVLTDSVTGNTATGTSALPADVFNDYSVVTYTLNISGTSDGKEPGDNAQFTVTVNPTNNTGVPITGNIIYSGTATEGDDYLTGSTIFSIPDGSNQAVITLNTVDDLIIEDTEIIIATISNVTTGRIATDSATVNLLDDDTQSMYIERVADGIDDPELLFSKNEKSNSKLKSGKTAYTRNKGITVQGVTPELAGGKIRLYINGKRKKTEKINSEGVWSVRKKIKKDAAYDIKLRYYDADGVKIKSDKYRVRVDRENPVFTLIPSVVMAKGGDTIRWVAKDNYKIKEFKSSFNGRVHKSKYSSKVAAGSFTIPAWTNKGKHILKIRAKDKAGNKSVQHVTIFVR